MSPALVEAAHELLQFFESIDRRACLIGGMVVAMYLPIFKLGGVAG